MKVLGFLRESDKTKMDAVQYYRTYLPLREVNKHDNGIDVQCVGGPELEGVTDDELGDRDIYTMCRMYHGEFQPFIDAVHRRGGVFVLDSDDDLTETYKMVSGHGSVFKSVLAAADYVTCSTPPLAELFAQYTQRQPVVLRNCLDYEWFRATALSGKRITDGITMGFSGSPTHWGDWYVPHIPWARIGKEYENVTLMTHGEVPRYLKYAGQEASLVQLGGVPYSIYPILLKQFDIVLCAVDIEDEFNAGKSAIKAIECMTIGVVPICSRFQPYLDLQDAGAPIVVIPEESRAGWYSAMRFLVDHPDLLEALAGKGPAWVKEHRDMCTTGYEQWQEFYRGIVE